MKRETIDVIGIGILTVAVALLFAWPVTSVSFGDAGSRVPTGAVDTRPTLYPVTANAWVARSDLATASTTLDDAFYLYVSATPTQSLVQSGAIRLASGTFGSIVASASTDAWGNFIDGTTVPLTGDFTSRVKYLETDGKPGYTRDDMVYWDAPAQAGCAGDGTLSICDLRLTTGTVNGITYAGGTVVKSGDADLVRAAAAGGLYPQSTTLAAGFTLFYSDGDANLQVGSGDAIYLRPPGQPSQAGAFVPIPLDVRLTASSGGAAGSKVAKGDADTVPTLSDADAGSGLRFAGLDCLAYSIDGGTSLTEYKYYLVNDTACTAKARVDLGDVIVHVTGLTPGTLVSSVATGYGKAITGRAVFHSGVFAVDADGNGHYSGGDAAYWNLPVAFGGDATAAKVTIGDLRLTPVTLGSNTYGVGSSVANGDTDVTSFASMTGITGFHLKAYDFDRSNATAIQALSNARVSGPDAAWTPGTEGIYVAAGATLATGDVRVFPKPGTGYGTASIVACPGDTDCPGQGNDAGALVAIPTAKVTGPDASWTSSVEGVYVSADDFANAPDQRVSVPGRVAGSVVANVDGDAIGGSPLLGGGQLYLGLVPVGTVSTPQRDDVSLVGAFSRVTTSSTTEWIPTLTVPTATTIRAARANLGDQGSFVDDGFYLSRATGTTLAAGDVRLVSVLGKAIGSQVASGDADQPTPDFACGGAGFAGCVGFVNVDAGSGYDSVNDIVYLDTSGFGFGSAGFSQGDIRLVGYAFAGTSFTTGSFVLPGNQDLTSFGGAALAAPACKQVVVKYWDDNGDGAFNVGDVAYVTFDTTGGGSCPAAATSRIARVLDVRVTGPGSVTSTSSNGGAQPGPTTTMTANLATTTSAAVTSSPSTSNPNRIDATVTGLTGTTSHAATSASPHPTKPTPAPGLILAVLAAGVVVVARRRSG